MRFLKAGGSRLLAGTLNAGPQQSGTMSSQSDLDQATNSSKGFMSNMSAIWNGDRKSGLDQATGAISQFNPVDIQKFQSGDTAGGIGSTAANLLMLRQAFKSKGLPEAGEISTPQPANAPEPAPPNGNSQYYSPNPPRSSLAKNQAQMAKATASGPVESPTEQGAIAQNSNLNSPSEAQGFLEQASQKIFNKPYDQLSVTEKLKTLQEGGRMQQEARTSAATPVDAEQGGHAGNGVASVEELNRPGANYLVSKSGGITYHGKSFAPEGTPQGSSHVTVLPNGEFRVNSGPELNPLQAQMLRKALPDTVPQTPRVPASDADRMELLMQSLKARGR